MKDLMYDERKKAEKIYRDGFTNGFCRYEAMLVCKYFRHIRGYGTARTKSALLEFAAAHDQFFSYVPYRNAVRDVLSMSKNDFVIKTDPLYLTDIDFAVIRTLNSYLQRKLLFVLLILFKLNNGYLSLYAWKNIRLLMRNRLTNRRIMECMTAFAALGLVKDQGTGHVLLIDEQGARNVLEINEGNIYNAMEIFRESFGEEMFVCNSCQKLSPKKRPNQKWCPECSARMRKESDWRRKVVGGQVSA